MFHRIIIILHLFCHHLLKFNPVVYSLLALRLVLYHLSLSKIGIKCKFTPLTVYKTVNSQILPRPPGHFGEIVKSVKVFSYFR